MHNTEMHLGMMIGQLILCSNFSTSSTSGSKQFLSNTSPGIWEL